MLPENARAFTMAPPAVIAMLAIVLLRNIRGDYFLFNQLVLSQNGERDIHNQQPGVACRQVEFWQRLLDGHLAEFCVPYRKPADKGGMIQGVRYSFSVNRSHGVVIPYSVDYAQPSIAEQTPRC